MEAEDTAQEDRPGGLLVAADCDITSHKRSGLALGGLHRRAAVSNVSHPPEGSATWPEEHSVSLVIPALTLEGGLVSSGLVLVS